MPLPAPLKNKRYGWFNLWGLRCAVQWCPCKMVPLDHHPGGWYCVDCGEQKGVIGEDDFKAVVPDWLCGPASAAKDGDN